MIKTSHQMARRQKTGVGQLQKLLDVAAQDQLLSVIASTVSQWTIGQQLHHIALVDRAILDTFDRFTRGEQEPVAGGPVFMGRVVLLLGRIPRGRGKAPSITRPPSVGPDTVREQLESVKKRLETLDLDYLSSLGLAHPHPVFGILSLTRWLRFIEIHHNHHTRIITDIRRADAAS